MSLSIKSVEEQIAQFQQKVATQLEPYMLVFVVNQAQDELIDFRIEPSSRMTALLALQQQANSRRPTQPTHKREN